MTNKCHVRECSKPRLALRLYCLGHAHYGGKIPAIAATKETELISAFVELMRDYHVKADDGFLYAVVQSVNSILGK